MARFLIGAGGWAYFQVLRLDPLSAYSKAFDFVEVNSTFYEYPSLTQVTSWRRRVPPHFEFSVRCHRSLTHKCKLEPTNQSFEIFDKMVTICKALRANILHLQTPPRLKFTDSKVASIRDFFHSINVKDMRIAWEARQTSDRPLPRNLIQLMQDLDIIHCIDLSKAEPACRSDALYTRLFGKGKKNIYQFTDDELMDINKKAEKGDYGKVVLCFHGVRMYKDAARFKRYRQTGRFPPVTKSIGLNSLREVLSEDAKFPTTKQKLIQHQGWKVIDLSENKRVHASEVLRRLPKQTYRNIEEIIQTLKSKHNIAF